MVTTLIWLANGMLSLVSNTVFDTQYINEYGGDHDSSDFTNGMIDSNVSNAICHDYSLFITHCSSHKGNTLQHGAGSNHGLVTTPELKSKVFSLCNFTAFMLWLRVLS